VLNRRDFPFGVGALTEGEAEARFHGEVVPAMQAAGLPAILCGMVGSNLGWRAVPYLDCPAGFAAMGAALHPVAENVWIVPGLRAQRPDGGPDVMRGEEVQVFGWVAMAEDRQAGEHLICHPGTHAKWIRLKDGRIDTFVTAMTGELFALARQHSSLRAPGAVEDEAAFALGLAAAADGGALASRMFTARARVVGGDLPAASAESYLSGLLIGAEVAATPALLGAGPGARVEVIGDPALCRLYCKALERKEYSTTTTDGDAAVIAGLTALFRMKTQS
jgi:2-dehydro-3-deoxygalactonokinase